MITADQQSLLDRNMDHQFTDQVLTFHGLSAIILLLSIEMYSLQAS